MFCFFPDCFEPANDKFLQRFGMLLFWIASQARNDEPVHRHSDRSMRSASGACVVEESLHSWIGRYRHSDRSGGICLSLKCIH